MEKYNLLKKMINDSEKIVVFTGAGISCPPPSNIKDFRSSDGLYSKKNKFNIPTEEMLTIDFFLSNTKDFYEFYRENLVFPNAICNDAHKYFAKLEESKDVTIITQNVDDLHTQAGSKKVLELHGNAFRNYCMNCKKEYSLKDIELSDVPICGCGAVIRPDVVLYGENLNGDVLCDARNSILDADLLIVVGTSLTVNPAASLIRYFKGGNFVIINKSKTPFDDQADLIFNEDIIKVVNNIKNNKKHR